MGKSKRKTTSPLQKEGGKIRRTEGEDDVSDMNEDSRSQGAEKGDLLADLKEFISRENARNSRALMEDMRRYQDERMSAIENSLSFALTTAETMAKRLSEVEQRAQQAESDFRLCVKRMAEMEQELDGLQQKELKDWLVFSGPVIPRLSRSNKNEDASQLLRGMLQHFMDFSMDMQQVLELHREERQINVRFTTTAAGSDRYILVRNKTKLRGSGLYIREKLTSNRQKIFNDLLQLKRENKVTSVFTRDGAVFVVVDRRDRPRPVRSDVALERLARELAETGAARHAGHPVSSRSTARPSGMAETGRQDRGIAVWEAEMRSPGSVVAEPGGPDPGVRSGRAAPGAVPGGGAEPADGASPGGGAYAADGAGSAGGSGPADGDGRTARTARSSCSPSPASSRPMAAGDGGPVSGSGPSGGPLAVAGGGEGGDGDDGSGGDGAAGDAGRRRRAPVMTPVMAPVTAPVTTPVTAPVTAPVTGRATDWPPLRPARDADGVRHRFGRDIRQYVRVHSKCD